MPKATPVRAMALLATSALAAAFMSAGCSKTVVVEVNPQATGKFVI